MRVTICQIDNRTDHRDDDLGRLGAHVSEHGSDFLLLPEMCFSDWLASQRHADADKWKMAVEAHEVAISKMAALGAGAVVSTRPIIAEGGSFRNEAYLWAGEEVKPLHQKHYLPDERGYYEATWYDRGPKSFEAFDIPGGRAGVQICSELWFFEWARHYARQGVELLCVPRATPHGTLQKWLAGGQTAAICAGAYCLSSNLWAPEGAGVDLGGMGWIMDPDGNVLATTSPDQPFVTIDIVLELAQKAKSTYPRYVSE
jgi:N-carbamoylputrescine amidase